MLETPWKQFWKRQNDAFRLSFATGLGCVGAAGALALCSLSQSGLHTAQGIAVVGLFYLAIALCGARWRPIRAHAAISLANTPRSEAVARRFSATSNRWEQN